MLCHIMRHPVVPRLWDQKVREKGQIEHPRSALGGDDNAGYQRVYEPRPLHFPADHGPHPEFRNEWWYVTGNLADADGRQFAVSYTHLTLPTTILV